MKHNENRLDNRSGGFLLYLLLAWRSAFISATEGHYRRFKVKAICVYRQGQNTIVGAVRGHREGRKKIEKVLRKGVDKWGNMWYIIDKLKSDTKQGGKENENF